MCDFAVTDGKRFRAQVARGLYSVCAHILNAHSDRHVGIFKQFTYSAGHAGDGQDKSLGHIVRGLGAAKNDRSSRDAKLLEQLRRHTVRNDYHKPVTHRLVRVQRGGIGTASLCSFHEERLKVRVQNER